MPNRIDNTLTVRGPADELAAFAAAARGRHPRTGDAHDDTDEPVSPFCFDALVPLPAGYSDRAYALAGYADEMAAWGVKWGGYEWADPVAEPGAVVYAFRTAWRPPLPLLDAVARAWSGLTFFLSWADADGGPEAGKRVWAGGDVDGPADERTDAVEGHRLWTALRYAARAGMPFHAAAGLVLADWLDDQGAEAWAADVRREATGDVIGIRRYPFRRPALPALQPVKRRRVLAA